MISVIETFIQAPLGNAQTIMSDHPIFKFKKRNNLTQDQLEKIKKKHLNKTEVYESTNNFNNTKNQYRKNIRIGQKVKIVEKHNQGTDNYTTGKVSKILTNKKRHPRGIKVKLEKGQVGRVQEILER